MESKLTSSKLNLIKTMSCAIPVDDYSSNWYSSIHVLCLKFIWKPVTISHQKLICHVCHWLDWLEDIFLLPLISIEKRNWGISSMNQIRGIHKTTQFLFKMFLMQLNPSEELNTRLSVCHHVWLWSESLQLAVNLVIRTHFPEQLLELIILLEAIQHLLK